MVLVRHGPPACIDVVFVQREAWVDGVGAQADGQVKKSVKSFAYKSRN